jgi:hypothetical protein
VIVHVNGVFGASEHVLLLFRRRNDRYFEDLAAKGSNDLG